MSSNPVLFEGKVNRYKSLELNLSDYEKQHKTPIEQSELDNILKHSEKHYLETQDISGVWLKVPKEFSWGVPIAVSAGYDFHHAKPGPSPGGYVMLTKWLETSRPNAHPDYAHHFIGVGGMVINEEGEVLTIREKYRGDLESVYSTFWKLPGGLVDPGESLAQAAVREVREETGVNAEFKGVLAFRHMSEFRWGCSDVYICCLMSAPKQHITASEHEVHECKWVAWEEYKTQKLNPLNQFFAECYDQYKSSGLFISYKEVENIRTKAPNPIFYPTIEK